MSGKSFFLRGKRQSRPPVKANGKKFDNKRKHFSNEEIDSDEELEEKLEIDESDVGPKKRGLFSAEDEDGSGSDVDETAQQKRLRLAESYLRERAQVLEQEHDDDDDDDERDEDERDADLSGALSRRLEDEVLDRQGRLIHRIADSITLLQNAVKQKRIDVQQSLICETNEKQDAMRCVTLRGHRRAVTCIALSAKGDFVFSGAKDGTIAKWNTISGTRERLVCRYVARRKSDGKVGQNKHSENNDGGKKSQENGHKHAVLAIATSCDDKFVASGDARGTILVWTFEDMRCLRALTGHRGAVTALAFRKVPLSGEFNGQSKRKNDEAAHTLFSASADRTVKQWDVDQLAYVDTLLGHEDAITGLDSLFAERCVTSGGRDASLRVFKPALESQLVFHGDGAAIECVAALSDRFFVSGSDRNSISLWNVMRKKPIKTVKEAHGTVADCSEPKTTAASAFDAGSSVHDLWVSAIGALPNSDIFATGARDGYIRLWQCEVDGDRSLNGDGEAPASRRITLSNESRRQRSEQLRGLRSTPLMLVPVRGVVNSIALRVANATASGTDELVVAVGAGREHKAGRWWKVRDAQNVVKVFRFALEKRARLVNQ